MKKIISVGMMVAIYWVMAMTILLNCLSAQNPPYPQSPVITDINWASASSIIRLAQGSDTWPITWADNDSLYTAYADGWGFQPFVPNKLSLGFAKVSGVPGSIQGFNIRSNDEQTGNGRHGKKASGMLMVEGVLYMWVRNANNDGEHCQLAWSDDYGKNWNWSSWKFQEFGYCTFINYGKNYSNARDNYVYTVSHDHPSAYDASDNFVLMRVPKGQILDRNDYEFFKEFDSNGDPVWTANVNQRGHIFTHPQKCLRSGISYNAAIDRYLWWQHDPTTGNNGFDTRFSGGFGIYDAPEPWGPWTTAYFTSDWDVGPGETASFPTKWMNATGDTLFLLFSGDDAFSVRKATLVVNPASTGSVNPPPIKGFKLYQNYPNPFNPRTRISFTVRTSEFVTLEIYDTLGREVDSLINRRVSGGHHSVEFDASNLESGVYFYKIKAGEHSAVKKMLVVK